MDNVQLFTYGDFGYIVDNKPMLELKLDISKDLITMVIDRDRETLTKDINIALDKYFELVKEIESVYFEVKDNIEEYNKDVALIKNKYKDLKYLDIESNININYKVNNDLFVFTTYIAFHAYYKYLYPDNYEKTMSYLKYLYDIENKYINNDYKIDSDVLTPYNIETFGDNGNDSKFNRCYYQIKNYISSKTNKSVLFRFN